MKEFMTVGLTGCAEVLPNRDADVRGRCIPNWFRDASMIASMTSQQNLYIRQRKGV